MKPTTTEIASYLLGHIVSETAYGAQEPETVIQTNECSLGSQTNFFIRDDYGSLFEIIVKKSGE